MRHCSDVSFILQKKERYGRLIVVCYFNNYTENQSCVIKSKQNLLYESKSCFKLIQKI